MGQTTKGKIVKPTKLVNKPVEAARAHEGHVRLIYQGNSITTARYEMSELQKDLMYTLQAAVRPDDPIDTVYTFRVQDIMHDMERDPVEGNIEC